MTRPRERAGDWREINQAMCHTLDRMVRERWTHHQSLAYLTQCVYGREEWKRLTRRHREEFIGLMVGFKRALYSAQALVWRSSSPHSSAPRAPGGLADGYYWAGTDSPYLVDGSLIPKGTLGPDNDDENMRVI